ncbi:MAG: hypothetical protein KAS32_04670 [Candidatus Peribacteraceae bacterium]|nr:hypothetical protein [Candidatus Peribacteraceae bacterium]
MNYISPKELHEWGLIFEINRKVLHPLGLALAVVLDSKKETIEFSNEVWDSRDDPEGFLFDEETFIEANKRYQKYLEEEGNNALISRKKALGYLEQTELNLED